MQAKILIVDDDLDIVQGLQKRLRWMGYDALTAENGEQALALIEREAPDLVLLDVEMLGLSGLDVLKRLVDRPRQTMDAPGSHDIPPCVIVITAFGTIARAVEAMRLGAFDFLTKPFDGDRLAVVIEKALAHVALQRRVCVLQEEIDSRYGRCVGRGPKWQAVQEMARQAAASSVTVLLQGETGTGKEVMARAIHRLSERSAKPFLVMNCAALPDALLENELFGHEKGAFTGAVQLAIGKLEAADGGTVFLDEIGDMPIAVQARLLRVLQDQEFYRVGGTKPIRTNVRFIAATNKDLKAAADGGRFRDDLYYRLAVLTITLPPLRERKEDLAELAECILQRGARTLGRRAPRLDPETLAVLAQYQWPGNIRELENVLMRAMVLCPAETIGPECVELPSASPTDVDMPPLAPGSSYHEAMERSSKELLLDALRRTGWNQTQAAELLGLNRTYLTKLLKQKGIPCKPPPA